MRALEESMAWAAAQPEDAFIAPAGRVSWPDWVATVGRYQAQLRGMAAARIGLRLPARPESFAALVATGLEHRDVYLIDELADEATVTQVATDHGLDLLIEADADGLLTRPLPGETAAPAHGWITLFTSGTTGTPKAVRHSWESLTRPVRQAPELLRERWLLTYRPNLYAGLQVWMQCLLNLGCLVLPGSVADANGIVRLMRDAKVTHVSATPSYWRWLMTLGGHETLAQLDIQQITLGGEIADQGVLDTLRSRFPSSRIVHIYATSEAGRCFSVTDGLEGFPARFLDATSPDGVDLRVVDGELQVHSANAMRASIACEHDPADWILTGDLVERAGDRYRFVARRSDLINVGGNKVDPCLVEQVVRGAPGVDDARVFARRSSLVGQMVACEFTVLPGRDAEQVKRAVQQRCLEQLASVQRPRILEVVPAITLSHAGKKVRQLADPGPKPAPTTRTT